ncbi:YrdB family protein [Kribbella sp. NPDC056861]|uniref:YrdB family protein n=1 Tax=Kribbella sp. NPDC056861 TaxID=3154857 RepID=UPI003446DEDF
MDEIWRWSNLGLAFAVELAGLAIFAWWGWSSGGSTVLRIVLAVGLPAIGIVVWGQFAAPTANYGNPAVTAIVKIAFFGLAGLALWALDHHVLATAFVLVVAANFVIIRVGGITVPTAQG